MFDLSKITNGIQRFAGNKALVIQKHSPEILTAVGVVGFGATIVTACKATLKVDDILTEHTVQIEKINAVSENPQLKDKYSEQDALKDKTIVYIQTGVKIVRNYLPSITLGALSIGCLLGANHILSKRNVALMGMYKACEQSFLNYRERVKEELGADKDEQFFYGIKEEQVEKTVTDKNGKEKTVTETITKTDPKAHSQYARFFDECNPNWQKNAEYNKMFLLQVQSMMNERLQRVGHVFLNEVYEALGFEHSSAGALVGWVYDEMESKDNFIDFGIFDNCDNIKRQFINGWEKSILLDFNVDGVIYDLI